MTWPAVVVAFFVCHAVGDVLLQTDRQAVHKGRGVADALGRRALIAHVTTYTVAFVPALVWVANDRGPARGALVAAMIGLPHLLVDDGWLVRAWLRHVKGAAQPAESVRLMTDQSLHLVCLLGAAALAAS